MCARMRAPTHLLISLDGGTWYVGACCRALSCTLRCQSCCLVCLVLTQLSCTRHPRSQQRLHGEAPARYNLQTVHVSMQMHALQPASSDACLAACMQAQSICLPNCMSVPIKGCDSLLDSRCSCIHQTQVTVPSHACHCTCACCSSSCRRRLISASFSASYACSAGASNMRKRSPVAVAVACRPPGAEPGGACWPPGAD